MRIDPRLVAGLAAPVPARRAGAAGSRFEPSEGAASGRTGGTRAAAPLATLDAILMLQGEEDPAERRRKSARRGRDLLDALDELKAALLSGRVPAAQLARLAARLSAGADPSGDAGLDEVVAHIELRAQVELAKLRRG